jgi:hypothetical protein
MFVMSKWSRKNYIYFLTPFNVCSVTVGLYTSLLPLHFQFLNNNFGYSLINIVKLMISSKNEEGGTEMLDDIW